MITLPDGLGGPEDIKKRFSVASERRQLWRSILKDMYDYCIPNRETFDISTPGDRKARHLFDSTAPEALQTFVSVVMSTMTPTAGKWMNYEAGSDIPEEDVKEVNKGLEKASDIFFKYLSHSDYESQVNISHQDMSISTGCLLVEEGNNLDEPLIKVTAIPLPQLYVEPTSLSRAHTCFRKHMIKAQELLTHFPAAEISEKLQKRIKDAPTSDLEIIDGVQVYNFKDKTYHQVVMWEDEFIFHQSYGDSAPAIIYRWGKVVDETYGRGPADMAMADIRTINKLKEFMLKNAALTMTPPLLGASDGIFNPHTFRLHPGSMNAVSDVSSPPVIPLEMGGDLRLTQFSFEDLKESIRKAFFADPLGDVTDPVRSATENMIRQQEMIKKRGANFGRLKSEFVVPFVSRVTDILVGAGKIPQIKVDGRDVTLKMSSQVSAAQEMESIDNMFVFLNALQSLPPEVAALGASLEQVPQFLQKNLRLPEELSRTPDQIKEAANAIIKQAQGGQISGQQAPV